MSATSLSELPQLDGVVFRSFEGPADYAHLARIITAHSKGEGDDRVETPEGIASGYEHLENCDPAHDLVVVEADGRPVGYTRVFWEQEADGPRVYRMFCFLAPAYQGRGIGTALVEWDMSRLREIAAEHEDAPEKFFETWLNDRNVAAAALIRGAGFEPITYSATMVRPTVDDLPDHRLPEGLEIRPVRDEDIRTIWEADVEAFRDHWGFVEQTEEGYQRFISFPYHDPSLAPERRREGSHRRVDPRACRPRNDRGRPRRPHREPERRLRPLRRSRVRGRLDVDDVPQAAVGGLGENGPRRQALLVVEQLVRDDVEDLEADNLHPRRRGELIAHRAP
jgi:GNAT superfamily N-acetyltransferase